jgi:N-acetyl-alpha-D-glucosaminyl L-malate synthase BshA
LSGLLENGMEQYKKLKVGVVCYPSYGGSGVIATELGAYLASQGHEMHFITSSQPVKLNVFSENIFFHEVSFNNYPLFRYDPYEIALTSKIVETVKREKLDLIHVHYALPHASAAYFAKQILEAEGLKLPIVTTLHGTDITLVGKDPSFEPVITFSINGSDAVTTVSESLKTDTLQYFKVTKEVKVVSNFVCVDKYKDRKEDCNKKQFAPNGEKLLIHISNFRKVKRIQDVVRTFYEVGKKISCKLLLIGDGPEKGGVEKLVSELGIEQSVIFTGAIKDTETALCMADLFLLASDTESFGLVALEAMAASVPVVSTNSGGLPVVNIHGETGLLNDVGDYHQMASNALEILKDELVHNEYKRRAFAHAELFDVSVVAPKYLEIYYSLIQSPIK